MRMYQLQFKQTAVMGRDMMGDKCHALPHLLHGSDNIRILINIRLHIDVFVVRITPGHHHSTGPTATPLLCFTGNRGFRRNIAKYLVKGKNE